MSTPDLFSALIAPADHFAAVGEKAPPHEHKIDGEATDGTAPLAGAVPIPRAKAKRILAPVAGEIFICATRPATFAEAIATITASAKVDAAKIDTFRREVNWVQTRLPRNPDGSPPAPLPCDPLLLRPILQTISPGRHNITAKRWYNIRSVLAAVQRMTGWLPPRQEKMPVTSKSWALGLTLFDDDRAVAMFRGFALFCEQHGLEPAQIEPQHLENYREYLELDSSKLSPGKTIEALRYAWNRLHREHPDWGGRPLPGKRSHLWIRSNADGIPAEFYADLDAYCAKLRNPGL